MKQVFRINGKQRWDMVTDEGERVRGGRITISDGQFVNDENKVGLFDTPFNVPYETFEAINHVPGDYELTLSMKVGSKGQFSVSGVRYVGDSTETNKK